MRLIDTVRLAETTSDGYGDKTVTSLTDVKSLFVQRSSYEHGTNTEGEVSDAAVYLDPKNPTVLENLRRENKDGRVGLEGMYIVAQPFGTPVGESWYRISRVNVAQRKLLNNAIDNIYCRLEKVARLPYGIS